MKIIYLNHFNDIEMTDNSIHDYAIYMRKPITYNSKIALVHFDDDEDCVEVENFDYILDISIINTDFVPYLDLTNKEEFHQKKNFKEIFYYGVMDAYLPDEMLSWPVEEIIKYCVEYDDIKYQTIDTIKKIDWYIGAQYQWFSIHNEAPYLSREKNDNSLPIIELKKIIDINKQILLKNKADDINLLYLLVRFNLNNGRAYTNEEMKKLLNE